MPGSRCGLSGSLPSRLSCQALAQNINSATSEAVIVVWLWRDVFGMAPLLGWRGSATIRCGGSTGSGAVLPFLPLHNLGVDFVNARVAPVCFDLCHRVTFSTFEQHDKLQGLRQ